MLRISRPHEDRQLPCLASLLFAGEPSGWGNGGRPGPEGVALGMVLRAKVAPSARRVHARAQQDDEEVVVRHLPPTPRAAGRALMAMSRCNGRRRGERTENGAPSQRSLVVRAELEELEEGRGWRETGGAGWRRRRAARRARRVRRPWHAPRRCARARAMGCAGSATCRDFAVR